ncbi:hypothetical protein GCM10022225_83420 [Plantactinospora mayteni]|uniref:Uncharacterized protein n=1 Tax=Plantactinospora mayteni TaxID=566021 RepID=A0ABQ4F4F8_9ACTN|nr:hypothetical protein Pma05_83370 [Plantactinospora mayteni]
MASGGGPYSHGVARVLAESHPPGRTGEPVYMGAGIQVLAIDKDGEVREMP